MRFGCTFITFALALFVGTSVRAGNCDYDFSPYVGVEIGALSTEHFDSLGIRALVVHFTASQSGDTHDLIMLFQAPYVNVYQELQLTLIQLEADFDMSDYTIELCYLSDLSQPKAYEAFFTINDNVLLPNFKVVTFIAPIASSSETSVATTLSPKPALTDYRWIAVDRVRAALPNLPGIITLRAECSSNEDFAILATGQVIDETPHKLRVNNLIGVTRNYGVSTNPKSRDSVEASVSFGDYWCPQKREFCYKHLDDGAFGMKGVVGQTITPNEGQIYALSDGLISAFALIMTDNCPRNDN